jgi:hypothetical protein
MTAMSLDFDRSPDGEPTPPASQPPVPAQQAPATTDEERPAAPSFTPKHAAGEPMDDELADDELAGDEPTVAESLPADATASEPLLDEPEPAAAEPAAAEPAAAEPAAAEPAVADATASEATAYHASAAPAWDAQVADDAATGHTAGIEPSADPDGPLLSDADELRTSWQRIQAAFVDDPREAVADAAGLVEHAAQALTSALRQRQRQLRAMWDRDVMPDGVEYADSGGAASRAAAPGGDRQTAADGPDTEQLRLLIQRYRRLLDHLSRQ